MTDRELLELAAKAAGVLTTSWYDNHAYIDGMLSRWNPLQDDGDALRLAVNLRMAIRLSDNGVMVGPHLVVFSESRLDPCAATRRAIVRAAAEIGKQTN